MAGNNIGDAALYLKGDGEQLTKQLDKSSQEIKNFHKHTAEGSGGGGMSALITGGLMGVGSAVANLGFSVIGKVKDSALEMVGFIEHQIKDIIGSIKELGTTGKQAKSLGIDSAAFMGLQAAAKKSGVEVGGFYTIMAKLGAKIGGAQVDTLDEFGKGLKKIGIDIKDLQQVKPEEAFLKIADAVKGIGNPSQQAAAAFQVFGKKGDQVLSMLQRGGPALREFMKEHEELGASISQDHMNGIMAAKAALPKLEAQFSGIWHNIVSSAAPTVALVAGKLSQTIKKLTPLFVFAGHVIEELGGIFYDVFSDISDLIFGTIGDTEQFSEALFGPANSARFAKEVVVGVIKEMAKAFGEGFNFVRDIIGSFATVLGEVYIQVADLGDEILSLVDKFNVIPDHLRPKWMDDAMKMQKDMNKMQRDLGEDMKKWGMRQMGVDWSKDIDAWFANRKKHKLEPLEDDWEFNPFEHEEKDKHEKDTKIADTTANLKDSQEAAKIITANMSNSMFSADKERMAQAQAQHDTIKKLLEQSIKQTGELQKWRQMEVQTV